MIVGLLGFARSGKSTLADLITLHKGSRQIAFADALRKAVYDTNPLLDVDGTRVQDAMDEYGYEGIKSTKYAEEMRRLMQAYGTDGVRSNISDSAWVDVVTDKISDGGNWTVTDCRYSNEVEAVRNVGGVILWVSRPGVDAINAHSSENSVSQEDADYVIYNHSTPSDMLRQVYTIMSD